MKWMPPYLPSLTCIVIAGVMACLDRWGWGFFLVLAVLLYPMSRD